MTLRKAWLLSVFALVPVATAAQQVQSESATPRPASPERALDFSKVVVPIGSFKIVAGVKIGLTGKISPRVGGRIGYGTGFCLDPICRFIVTNYHVAKPTSARKIRHQRIRQRYFATGADDHEATMRFISGFGALPYAAKRDLALLELREPIRGYHGIKYSLDDLQPRQEVDIYSFPYESNPFRGLTRVTARFNAETTSGLLAFDCEPSADNQIHLAGGSSGGIVVDHRTQRIVGILNGLNGTMAVAVPVSTLVDFVSKVQPFVAVKTFPAFKNLGPDSVDIYPQFEPQPDFNAQFKLTHSGVLERRPVEPNDVVLLREKAQRLADSMKNFIAVQSYEWGNGDHESAAQAEYEVKVVDGKQTFRRYPYGKKDLWDTKLPRLGEFAYGSDEWAKLPKVLGTEYRLKIQRADDVEIDGKKIRIFQYRAELEDELCSFELIDDYGFFSIRKIVQPACHGEAWVDDNGDIIRISQNLELSDKRKEYRGWHEFRTVLTYGQIKIADEPSRLAPITTFAEGHNGKKIYWCRGTFSNYRLFASHSRFLTAIQTTDVPPDPQ